MGVKGLWTLLSCCGHRIPIESLSSKTLAIDISIWLYQFIKGMADGDGKARRNAHLIGVMNRMLKLMGYNIRPIVVFDGKAPVLKGNTIRMRKWLKENSGVLYKNMANKLLLNQLSLNTVKNIRNGVNVEEGEEGEEEEKEDEVEIIDVMEDEIVNTNTDIQVDEAIIRLQDEIKVLQESIEDNVSTNRPMFLQASTSSNEFSSVQMNSFLASSIINRKVAKLKQELSAKLKNRINEEYNLPAHRINSDHSKEYIFQRVDDPTILFNLPVNNEEPITKKRKIKEKFHQQLEKSKMQISRNQCNAFWNCINCQHPNISSYSKCVLCATSRKTDNSAFDELPDSSDYLFDNLIEENIAKIDEAVPFATIFNNNPNANIELNNKPYTSSSISNSTPNLNEKLVLPDFDVEKITEVSTTHELFEVDKNIATTTTIFDPTLAVAPSKRNVEFLLPSPAKEIESVELILRSIDASKSQSPQISDEEENLQDWECDLCYFKNHVLSPVCEICSNVQPSQIDLNPKIHDIQNSKTVQKFENKISYTESNLLTLKNSKNNFYELNNKKSSLTMQSPSKIAVEKTVTPIQPLTVAFLEEESENLSSEARKELRNSETVTEEMINEVKELLVLFGIPYVEAPGEAEAQCAELYRLSLVDGIVTDDCDVFLFGGGIVYKNIFEDSKFVEKYDSNDINKELGLDRKKFIDLAQLLGSDYTVGVKGVGIVNAMEIISAFPDSLNEFKSWIYNADQPVVPINMPTKQEEFKLKHNKLRHKWGVDIDFPSIAVENAYLNPNVISDNSQFEWSPPDYDAIKTFCMDVLEYTEINIDNKIQLLKDSINLKNVNSSILSYFNYEKSANVRSIRLKKSIKGITESKN